jgi:HME family heavy-metal exporter
MLDTVIRASIRNRVLVLLAAGALVVAGLAGLGHARFDVLPDFTPPMVVVQTEAAGLGAPDVDAFVTAPLEQVLLGTPEATSVRSSSSAGLSVVTLSFGDDADLFRVRQLVAERLSLAAARMPRGTEPRIAPISAPIGALLKFWVTAGSDDDQALRDVRTWASALLAPRLLAIPGVASVTVHGGQTARIEVRPDPERLRETGVSLEELAAAVRGSAAPGGGGFVEAAGTRLDVQVDARLDPDTAVTAIAAARVAGSGGSAVRVGDVAWVGIGSEPLVGSASYDGQAAVYLQVNKLPWADTLATTSLVEDAIAVVAPSVPRGAAVRPPVFRQADFVRTSLHALLRSMAFGASLVVVVLLVVLRSPRLAGISLAAIPLSVLAATAILVAAGAPIDGMVLGGLAISVGRWSTTPSSGWRTSGAGSGSTPGNQRRVRRSRWSQTPPRRSERR